MVDVERQLVPLVAVAAQDSEWKKLVRIPFEFTHGLIASHGLPNAVAGPDPRGTTGPDAAYSGGLYTGSLRTPGARRASHTSDSASGASTVPILQ